jgi:hypothetical protein
LTVLGKATPRVGCDVLQLAGNELPPLLLALLLELVVVIAEQPVIKATTATNEASDKNRRSITNKPPYLFD